MSFLSPEAVLWNQLISDASVTAYVGHRIYPHVAKANDNFPFITWRRTSISREQTLGTPMGVPTVSVTYEIFASSYITARKIADAVRRSLDGFSGSYENTTVSLARLTGESDDAAILEGSEVPVAYSVTQDYDILWQES
jgi:hypothetical protein